MFHVVFFSGEVLLRLASFFLPPEPLSKKVRKSPICSELQPEPREGREKERTCVLELILHADTEQQDSDSRILILHRLLQ